MIRRLFKRRGAAAAVADTPVPAPRAAMYHVLHPFGVVPQDGEQVRITMLLPSVHRDHLTGGPATLVNYLVALRRAFPDFACRMVPVMVPFEGTPADMSPKLPDFTLTPAAEAAKVGTVEPALTVIPDAAYKREPLAIGANDVFIATMWPTHHLAKALQAEQARLFGRSHKAQYVIQDYEPSAIYPWSDQFLLARQTYEDVTDTIAVVGTRSLAAYLEKAGHHHQARYVFEPGDNVVRKDLDPSIKKEELIVVYCRPDTPRNCFDLIIEALLAVTAQHPSVAERFRFISVGEAHPDYLLNNGAVLESQGFMPVSDYNDLLLRAAIGCFFVVSPHSGYVGIEMARSGMLAISNSFETKDISGVHPNIRAVSRMNVAGVADALVEAVREYWTHPDRQLAVAAAHETEVVGKTTRGEDFPFIGDMIAEHYGF